MGIRKTNTCILSKKNRITSMLPLNTMQQAKGTNNTVRDHKIL